MSVNVTEYESTLGHDGLRIRILLLCVRVIFLYHSKNYYISNWQWYVIDQFIVNWLCDVIVNWLCDACLWR